MYVYMLIHICMHRGKEREGIMKGGGVQFMGGRGTTYMYLCVCACVCMCLIMYLCIYVCMYVWAETCVCLGGYCSAL